MKKNIIAIFIALSTIMASFAEEVKITSNFSGEWDIKKVCILNRVRGSIESATFDVKGQVRVEYKESGEAKVMVEVSEGGLADAIFILKNAKLSYDDDLNVREYHGEGGVVWEEGGMMFWWNTITKSLIIQKDNGKI